MLNILKASVRRAIVLCPALFGWRLCQQPVLANPTGGSVAQGGASFSTSGSQETITTSGNTFINWQSFNIGAGETTTFVEPSSSSVVWNNINGSSPSQILGNLNANGYVILQNQAGFYVGGQAAITTHGLIMTTAASSMPNLSSGGAWSFDLPPPTAKIVNYGQINSIGGGPAFLIANDIENNGTISAPSGKIGLYAGEQVLVSMSPDGRGLSAQVTLPEGSVDNEGKLIADGGAIAAQAQTVNQNGLIQANSVQNVNGTIELIASDAVNLGANSAISAQGGSVGVSAGGSVTIQSANTYSDQAGSTINISGGAQGGNGGQVEISAPEMGSIQSSVNGQAVAGFVNGTLTIDPANIWLAASTTDPSAPAGYSIINVNSFNGLSQINLQADNNITLNTVWNLANSSASALLSLTAGNDITLNASSSIAAGNNWNVSLTAGTGFAQTSSQSVPASGSDGVYLNGTASIQTQNGNINVWAANELLINSTVASSGGNGAAGNGIRTLDGGSIDVTAQYGNVNTGGNASGYLYNSQTAPYYTVSSTVGGISTVDGGNVNINAGGNVTSYLPGSSDIGDPGTGTFGAQPGNLTITAGGNITGHYVVADGVGTIVSANGNVGNTSPSGSFALSLIDGSWNVSAPNGNIYLQEVRNPNGIFNGLTGGTRGHPSLAGENLFNYSPDASVSLNAMGVYLTSQSVPRLAAAAVPVLYPPILDITAGSGGVTIEGDVTLFPSAEQNLSITVDGNGNFVSTPGAVLFMSDSSAIRWVNANSFSYADNSVGLPVQASDPNPVVVDVSGNMENVTLITSKETQIDVGGDMVNCGFSGQNLHASDVTSITVGGQIFNQGAYAFVNGVAIPAIPAADLIPGMGVAWDDIFILALNPSAIAGLTAPKNATPAQLLAYALQSASLFGVSDLTGQWVASGGDQGFIYNSATGQLGYGGPMSASVLAALSQPITVLKLVNGAPVLDASGHFETQTINWAPASQIETLFAESQPDATPQNTAMGYRIGGPGEFDVSAGSISLGNSYGILSLGVADTTGGYDRYGNLASITPQGASVNVSTTGNLDMLTSTIATLGGGDVNVLADGSMDLGSADLYNSTRQVGFGIFSAGPGNVTVTAVGDVNIDGSRIATYDGGDIVVESLTGSINVGTGGNSLTGVYLTYVNPVTGLASSYAENVFGSGIVANTLVPSTPIEGYPPASYEVAAVPGNITVLTPEGNITSSLGGITQISLNGTSTAGPTITLDAGSPGYVGNIDLGQSGVIGGSVNATASGNITGLIISRQNTDINAAQNFSGSVLAGGSADVSGGGTVTGVIVGVGGASVSGSTVSAQVLGQNVSVNGGAAVSTLGASATASSTSQSAAQQASSTSQQLANNDSESDDDKKKKKKEQPLMQRIKRVTVILPKST